MGRDGRSWVVLLGASQGWHGFGMGREPAGIGVGRRECAGIPQRAGIPQGSMKGQEFCVDPFGKG